MRDIEEDKDLRQEVILCCVRCPLTHVAFQINLFRDPTWKEPTAEQMPAAAEEEEEADVRCSLDSSCSFSALYHSFRKTKPPKWTWRNYLMVSHSTIQVRDATLRVFFLT